MNQKMIVDRDNEFIEIETWLGVFGNKEYLMEEIENGHSEFWKSFLNLYYISRIVPLYGNKYWKDLLAQLAEHCTFNAGVPSSNLGGVTK